MVGTNGGASTGSRQPYLDALRGASVLAVIIGHAVYLELLPQLPGPLANVLNPALAVGLFFALSGFLVAASFERDRSAGGAARVITIRAARLFGPFLVAAAIYTLPIFDSLMAGFFRTLHPAPAENMLGIGLLGGWLPPPSPGAIVPGSWSISAEWLAALLIIPLTVRLVRSPRTTLMLALAAALAAPVLVGLARLATTGSLVVTPATSAFDLWALANVGTFVIGVWAYRAAARGIQLPIAERRLLLWGTTAVLLLGLALAPSLMPAAGLGAGLLCYRVSLVRSNPGRTVSFLGWLGQRSYGAYLFHFIGLAVGLHVAAKIGLPAPAAVLLLIVSGLSIACFAGELTRRFTERPSISLGRALAVRLFPPQD